MKKTIITTIAIITIIIVLITCGLCREEHQDQCLTPEAQKVQSSK